MLEMAILETQFLKYFWGECPPPPSLKILDLPCIFTNSGALLTAIADLKHDYKKV